MYTHMLQDVGILYLLVGICMEPRPLLLCSTQKRAESTRASEDSRVSTTGSTATKGLVGRDFPAEVGGMGRGGSVRLCG